MTRETVSAAASAASAASAVSAGSAASRAAVEDDVAGPHCAGACHSRRSVLAAAGAAGAVALTGCGTYGARPPVVNEPITQAPPPTKADEPADGKEAKAEPAEEAQPALASLSDIPVGGGVVFADKGIVVTHPKEGTIKAFSSRCTHAGCVVTEVSGGTINCNCHGSKFAVTDGSVSAGPANKPLDPVGVKVTGESIVLT